MQNKPTGSLLKTEKKNNAQILYKFYTAEGRHSAGFWFFLSLFLE